MNKKPNESLRIVFLNHQGFATDTKTKEGKAKDESLRLFITNNNIDIMLLAENNVHWESVTASERLEERTSTWFEALRMSNAFYRNFKPDGRQQFGGTSAWCINETAYRVIQSGVDNTGLGRWAWQLLRGRDGVTLRAISAYRPVKSSLGATTVWQQQKTFFVEQGEDGCPRRLFNDHLIAAVKEWMEKGEQIVLGIDYNDSLNSQSELEKRLQEIGVVNAIRQKHRNQTPPTRTPGTNTIDSIFVSRSLTANKCGYMEFQANYDHRPTWIDIPYPVALGHKLPPVIRPPMRRLQTKNAACKERYIKIYWKFLQGHDLANQAENLFAELPEPTTFGLNACPFSLEQKERYDQLDAQRTYGMLLAERLCRKLRMGNADWSPKYQELRWKYDYWKKTVDQLSGKPVNKNYLMKLAKRANISEVTGITLPQAIEERSAAYKDKRKAHSLAPQVRKEHIDSLAKKAEDEGRVKEAQEFRERWKREQQRKDSRTLKRIMGKFNNGGLSHVVATDENGQRREMRTKEEIEQACLKESNQRFRQASNTPFLSEPLFEMVGPLGMGPSGDAILSGKFIPPEGTDPYAVKLIQHLRMTDQVRNAPPMDISLNVEQFKRGWEKAKESTSSGRSGIHFGHCKAGIDHSGICRFEAIMANIPYQTGHVTPRWKQEIGVMLQKKKDKHDVETTRTIMLFEPDWNQNNKLLGKSMMARAEAFKTIAREQYGSRKAHSAIDHCINKRLTFDIIRQKRIPGAHLASDAVSCYDRIVHSVAALAMRAQGVPAGPIICMFNTLQEMQHYVRTVYGDSQISFQSNDPNQEVPIQGVGQGNGAGPQIWAVTSSPVINMLRKEKCICIFRMAITGGEVQFVGYAFVDDTDKVVTSTNPMATYEEVAQQLQQAADTWEGGIRATGGAIGPTKSHYYLLDFVWNDGNFRYATAKETPAQITVLDKEGKRQPLERMDPNKAERTLGVHLAPDGNDDDQFNALLEKSKAWADQVRAGHLPRRLALQSLKQSLFSSLKWPLAATCLSEEQCKKIMQPALQAGLPRIGIVASFPRDLVHGPKKYLGLALPNLFAHQLASHIQKIILYCQSSSLTGELLRTSMQQLKVELGTSGSVFEMPYQIYGPLATRGWIQETWKNMQSFGIRILDFTPDLPLQSENDRLIIPAFVQAGFESQDLVDLNKVRLFLRVASAADLVCANGHDVDPDIWQGKTPSKRRPQIDWPKQGAPSPRHWKLWQAALTKTFQLSVNQRKRSNLDLGPWIERKNHWEWYLHSQTERLYQHSPTGWVEWHRFPGRSGRHSISQFSNPNAVNETPTNLLRASVYERGPIRCLKNTSQTTSPMDFTVESDTSVQTIEETIDEILLDKQWAVREWYFRNIKDNGALLAEAIQSPQGALCISDGSFKDGLGTACFTLLGKNEEGSIICPMVVPGDKSVQGAYRSELWGLYGAVTMINILCKTHQIDTGTVHIGCDGLSALKRAIEQSGDTDPLLQHFDVISAIRKQKMKSPVRWIQHHVLGHQDKNSWNVLDRSAFYNCEMDRLAKERWQRLNDTSDQTVIGQIEGEAWPVYIADRKISQNFLTEITGRICGTKAKEYWGDHKQRFGEGTADDVDFQATEDAMSKMTIARQHWLAKHATGFNAVGKNMKRRKIWTHSKCPRCEYLVEDSEHVLRCKGSGAREHWDDLMNELEGWMKKQMTAPAIIIAICEGLQTWHQEQSMETERFSQPMQETIQQQNRIGWRNLLEGFPASKWKERQDEYLSLFKSKRSGRRWIAALVQKLAETAWKMWDHRNSVNNANDTATLSLEVNRKIDSEYAIGFRKLCEAAQNLAKQSKEKLQTKGLNYRVEWLRSIEAHRARQQVLESHYRIPLEIQQREGYVWWVRNNKPSLDEYRAMNS